MILGLFVLSGIVRILGVSTFQPSRVIVNGAQIILGTYVGCSFVKSTPSEVVRC
jgi:hypothetical protein